MIEVCASFKCSQRTWFLSVAILDKYLTACYHNGIILENRDIHKGGVASMYMASKMEDTYPLHSRIVSEKIAHNAISAEEIVQIERDMLVLFDFNMDFVTHYDFSQTYCDKIEKQINHNLKLAGESISFDFITKCQLLLAKMSEMTTYLTRMSI